MTTTRSKFQCEHCGKEIDVPGHAAGLEAYCPHCRKVTLLQPPKISEDRLQLVIPPIAAPPILALPEVSAVANKIIDNIEKVIVGKHEQVVLAVAALLAEGHLLLEDVPGVAKTMLGRALAHSTGCSFKRIQCTPDLQPFDVLGGASLDSETGEAQFQFGPLFSQIVLVDEINRASPRTQAALLEAMGEASITSGKVTYKLEHPFMVIATQNPIDQEGVYGLPEAQLDRFLVRMHLGYPQREDELEMMERFQLKHPIDQIKSVTTPDRIVACQEAIRSVPVPTEVMREILRLVRDTREHPALLLGASPRASLGIFRAAQAFAVLRGKASVTMDEIKTVAPAVLTHRLLVRREPEFRQADRAQIISELLAAPPRA